MVAPLRHRQTKEAETDMFDLQPPRHISTLHKAAEAMAVSLRQLSGEQRTRAEGKSGLIRSKLTPSRQDRIEIPQRSEPLT
jgi:hypothetical protein